MRWGLLDNLMRDTRLRSSGSSFTDQLITGISLARYLIA